MLASPKIDSAINLEAAEQFKKNTYNEIAR